MAEQGNPQQRIEQPAGAGSSVAEPAFFVMPEDYRHGATGKKMAVPEPPSDKSSAPTAPPAVPVPPRPTLSGPKKGMPRHIKALLVSGVILLVGLGIAGYLVIRNTKAPAPASTKPAPVTTTRPAPETKPSVPSKPTTTETPAQTPSPFPTAKTSGTDTDSDGLADLEESLVYGTNPRLPDTDGDGFLDGNEVFHRYNPGGTAPGALVESGLVKVFTGPASDAAWYRILYPSVWSSSVLTLDWGSPTTFVATTGEKMTVTVFQRQAGMAFADEIAKQRGETGAFAAGITKNGYASLTSQDQLTVYIDGFAGSEVGAGYAVKVTYDLGTKTSVDYLQTFKMMVNSLEWL
jgi:hypothetical protein